MLTKLKIYACYTVNIYKNKPKKFSNRGSRALRSGPGSAFDFSKLFLWRKTIGETLEQTFLEKVFYINFEFGLNFGPWVTVETDWSSCSLILGVFFVWHYKYINIWSKTKFLRLAFISHTNALKDKRCFMRSGLDSYNL